MNFTKLSLLLCIVLAGSQTSRGGVIAGASSGDFIDVGLSLTLLGGGAVVDAQIHGLAPAAGTSPPAYNIPNSVATVNVSEGTGFPGVTGAPIGTVAHVETGIITSIASSDVDGLLGSRFAEGSNSIADLDLSVVELLNLDDLISITASAINVESRVSGDFGTLTAFGTLDVADLVISISGVTLATLNGSIAPNTGIDLAGVLGGATLILNQQITTGDIFSNLALTTNAISLNLSDVGVTGVGTLGGNVIVGESFASLQAAASTVPEPSSAILLGLLAAAGAWELRRSKRKSLLTAGV